MAIILIVTTAFAGPPSTLEGTVIHVRDGDTIVVDHTPIRLDGVSAPELNEPLGAQSKAFMVDFVLHKRVRCELTGNKTHDRWVGVCYLAGVDIGRAVIAAGLALDCPKYSHGRYARDEVEGAAARMVLPGYCLGNPR